MSTISLLGEAMKISIFDFFVKEKNYFYVYNVVTNALYKLNKSDFEDLMDRNENNFLYKNWVEDKLIVNRDVDEYKFITQKDYQYITIFTTTACNARCKYCFEQGIKTSVLNPELCNKAVDVLLKNLPSKHIHIQWFGGEPLLNIKAIELLSKEIKLFCKENNKLYTSSIITNGSLITHDIADKMKNDWNINHIQITLDGTEKKYNKTKRYCDSSDFKKVIRNIFLLLKFDLNVSIRVNFDKSNIIDSIKLIKYLNKIGLSSDKINLYFMPINHKDKNKNEKLLNKIPKYFYKIFKELLKYGYIEDASYFNLHPSFRHCQAETQNSFSVLPDLGVIKCSHEKTAKINLLDDTFSIKNLNSLYKFNNDPKCDNCHLKILCQGGCKFDSQIDLRSNSCSKCFVYKDSMGEIFKILEKLSKKHASNGHS